jgi:hypothetical protein
VTETRIATPDEWVQPGTEDRIADRISIPDLVATFRQAEAEVRASFASINAAVGRLKAVGAGGEYLRLRGRHDHQRYSFDWADPTEVITELRRDVWATLIERMQLRRAMSIEAWAKLEKQIKEDEPPEISIENVESMVAQFRDDAPVMLKAAVDEVFHFLRPPGSAFKTNTEFELGERVVLSGYVSLGYGRCWDVNHYRSQNLIALENVFRMLDGKVTREEGSYYGDLHSAIEKIPNGEKCRGKTDYFEFVGYRNHNLHLRFVRLDLVAKLNQIAGGARLKPVGVDR